MALMGLGPSVPVLTPMKLGSSFSSPLLSWCLYPSFPERLWKVAALEARARSRVVAILAGGCPQGRVPGFSLQTPSYGGITTHPQKPI